MPEVTHLTCDTTVVSTGKLARVSVVNFTAAEPFATLYSLNINTEWVSGALLAEELLKLMSVQYHLVLPFC